MIGRNEGERLQRCLRSVIAPGRTVVYIDSGSTDGSVAMSEGLGAHAFGLDMRQPFTAARARNEGVRRLAALAPEVEFIQFVDGDCEVGAGWIGTARAFLEQHADVAAVCGRRRERHPERSIYNLLCDIEWNTPIGEAKACGGDVLMRALALRQVVGYRDDLIAGEEPELCVRLRAKGWKVWRLDAEMTLHDAAMTRFGQWWQRTSRAGYAFAEGAHLHGAPPERHWVRESRSGLVWGIGMPLLLLLAAALVSPLALLGFAIYLLQVLRLFLRERGPTRTRFARAAFLVLGRFAEAWGQLKFFAHRLSGTRGRLIEYK
ncbi:MAG: glycosyltransferase [Burkholderiales bacterium]